MRPHTVILGAGATVAAIPNGDKNGRHSSVMKGLIEKLDMTDILKDVKLFTQSDNLEDIYSELYERPECREVVVKLEQKIYEHFSSLELPDEPTVYDFLILSLTRKDFIATFNWDPLLIQAYIRCARYTSNLPHIFCLHGNVAMGYCEEHKEFGATDAKCPVCKKPLSPTKLLYPIAKKSYSDDDYIRNSWEAIEYAIENSYMLTIFGYSAPTSDKEAVELLKKAWGDLENRDLEEVSVIDIVDEATMLNTWKDFIFSHHYRYADNFFDSYLGLFPRRSCEMTFATFQLNVMPDIDKGFHPGMSWPELEGILKSLLIEEMETPKDKNYPPHYIHKNAFSI